MFPSQCVLVELNTLHRVWGLGGGVITQIPRGLSHFNSQTPGHRRAYGKKRLLHSHFLPYYVNRQIESVKMWHSAMGKGTFNIPHVPSNKTCFSCYLLSSTDLGILVNLCSSLHIKSEVKRDVNKKHISYNGF